MRTQEREGCQRWLLAGIVICAIVAGGIGMAAAQQAPASPTQPSKGERLLTPEDREAMAQIFWHRTQERVGLNDQQVADIRTLLQNQRNAVRGDVQALRAARRQLRDLLGQQTADQAAIQSAATQVKSLRDKLFDQRLQTQLAIRSKLTPEQLARWIELRKGMGHRGWRRGNAFGRGLM